MIKVVGDEDLFVVTDKGIDHSNPIDQIVKPNAPLKE